jgi:hypothetical protein
MAYKGKYKVKNPKKYMGDPTKVIYRSLWERQCFKYCEASSDIVAWNSEETVVPYRCKTDNKVHRYFIDLTIRTAKGEVILVEIKPKKETVPPKQPQRKTKRYINEVMTYVKNQSKWEAASEFAANRGWKFQVWTEDTLKAMGIKLLKG